MTSSAWLNKCILGRGEPLPILANALIALEATMPAAFAYDEMIRATMLMTPLKPEADFLPRTVRDVDVGLAQEKLQHLGLTRVSKDTVHQAVDIRASERRFHPVRDYLSSLSWDGEPRIAKFACVYLGSEPTPYADQIGSMFLEPISKSSEKDNEAGELDKAEEVLSVVLPADEDATLPLYPGEEALDEPAPHVTA